MPTREQANTGVAQMANSHTCQPGSLRLLNFLMATFHVGNDGCFNPLSKLSSGSPSWHVWGKAIDAAANWNDPTQRARGDAVWNWVLANRDALNLQQMIWGTRIWDVSYQAEHHYGGGDHFNHVHIALGFAASQHWYPPAVAAPAPKPKPKSKRGKRMNLVQVHGGNAIAVTDEIYKRILTSPLQLGEAQWLIGVQGGNPNVTFISQESWDALVTVNVPHAA